MFRVCLHFLYYLHSILGLIPFEIDAHRVLQVRRSQPKCWWTLTIGCVTTVLVCYSFYTILMGISVPVFAVRNATLIRCFVLVECSISYCTIVITFYQIIHHESKLYHYGRRFIAIAQSQWCNRSCRKTQRTAQLLTAKVLLVDIGLCTLFALNYGVHTPTSLQEYRLINVYVMLITAQINNALLLTLLFGSQAYSQINKQLDDTIGKLLSFETHASYWAGRKAIRQQICCDASDTIDRMCALHEELTEIVRTVFTILQLPILLINLNQFIVILTRIFFMYVTITQKGFSVISYHRFSNSVAYICYEIVQCFLLTLGSAIIARKARKPGTILNAAINAQLDTRTERSIELFALALLANDTGIKVAGLYGLDLMYMFSLATTINMYVIVLVQFQLNMH
uniref:Gustatory receptor n=1 Tax=Anopheles farauti TaxID=69004 RepID=A0A182QUZ0_9DIPT